MRITLRLVRVTVLSLAFLMTVLGPMAGIGLAADTAGFTEAVGKTAEDVKDSVQRAGENTARSMEEMWRRIDQKRLVNRDQDELVGWVMMGLLAAGIAGLLSILRETSFQRYLNVFLGLAGAFLGSILLNLTGWHLGLGPILITYEDLLFSLAGGLLLIVSARFIIARRKKKV